MPLDSRAGTSGPALTPGNLATMTAGDELNAIQSALSSPAIFNGPWSLDPATGQFKSPPPNVSQCGAYIEAYFGR